MWIWIVCLVVLVICFIIAWRMLMNSYDLNNTDEKKFRLFGSMSPSDISFYTETIRSMRSKLKSLEDKSEYYESQIDSLNKKLRVFEKKSPTSAPLQVHPHALMDEEGEDWKELYYAENGKKEKLENELDASHQEIEFLEEQLVNVKNELEKAVSGAADNKKQDEEIAALRRTIDELHKGIEEAAQLQKLFEEQKKQLEEATQSLNTVKAEKEELERQLRQKAVAQAASEEKIKSLLDVEKQLEALQKEKEKATLQALEVSQQNQSLAVKLQEAAQQKAHLEGTIQSYQSFKTENDDLKNRLHEIALHQPEIEKKINQFNELEQHLKTLAEEKADSEKKLAEAIRQNENLERELQRETELKQHFEEAANVLATVRNERDGLQRQVAEMTARQSEIEGKILYINELENKVSKYEEDKLKMIADLEMLLSQSRFNHS